ncbi:protein translocase subunit SecD [Rhodospirillum sp. A1_3_36]|uniref:protein translocase subunit SecD n=1 Tax=Rhodospirillum sp. A1_3_36 TaxID=3391666 RepID=UPI0039A6A222
MTLSFPKWKMALVILVALAGLAFTIPNFMRDRADTMPSWWQPVTLGLDLQGGSYLLLQVEFETLVNEQLESLVESVRTALRGERIRYSGLGMRDGAVSLTITNPDDRAKALRLLRGLESGVQADMTDDGRVSMSFTEQALIEKRTQAVDQSIEIVRRRVDETGTREPSIQRQGQDRIIVELPGIDNPERVKALIGQTAKLTFHLLDETVSPEDAARGRIPPGSKLLDNGEAGQPGQPDKLVVRKRVEVSGDRLVGAQASFQNGEPVVSFRFDTVGGRKFGQVTSDAEGKFLAIVLDNRVISAPRIREPILGGSGIISGNFTTQEAQDLALLLRAGALPAPLTVLEERTVGPGLGADSIAAGELASVLGLVAVVVFMIFAYGQFGIFANIALTVNICLLIGILSGLGATLTLPGIAGIALTIGMAVDANVLIFERIREESRLGKSLIHSIQSGFSNAFSAILDANVTTLFAAALLFYFGSGPVRGFAVTLSVGVLTSMFTAIMVTRFIISVWVRHARPKTLPI